MDINELVSNPLFWAAMIWSLAWKGVALWRAARLESKPWFVVLFIVNTFGLLEILYLAVFSKRGDKAETKAAE